MKHGKGTSTIDVGSSGVSLTPKSTVDENTVDKKSVTEKRRTTLFG